MSLFMDSFRQDLLRDLRGRQVAPPAAEKTSPKQIVTRTKVVSFVDVACQHHRLPSSGGCISLSSNSQYIVVGCVLPAAKLQLFDAASFMCIASIPLPPFEDDSCKGNTSSPPLARCGIAKLIWVRGVEVVGVITENGAALLVPTGLRNRFAGAPRSSDEDSSEDESDNDISSSAVSLGAHLLDIDSVDFSSVDQGAILSVTHTSSLIRFVCAPRPALQNFSSCVSPAFSVTTLSATCGCVLAKDSLPQPMCWVVLFVGVSVLTFKVGLPEDFLTSDLPVTAVHTLLLGRGVVPICILRNLGGSTVHCLCWEHNEAEAKPSLARRQNRHVLLVDGAAPSLLHDVGGSLGDETRRFSVELDHFTAAPLNSVVGGSRAMSTLTSSSLLITQRNAIPVFVDKISSDGPPPFQIAFPQRLPSNESAQNHRMANLALCVASFDPAGESSRGEASREVSCQLFQWKKWFSKLNSQESVNHKVSQSSVRFFASGTNCITLWTPSCCVTIDLACHPNVSTTTTPSSSPIHLCSDTRDVRKLMNQSTKVHAAENDLECWSGLCVKSDDVSTSRGSENFMCYALLGQLQTLQSPSSENETSEPVPRSERRSLSVMEDPSLVFWSHLVDGTHSALDNGEQQNDKANSLSITESSVRRIVEEENAKLLQAIDLRVSSMEDRILKALQKALTGER
ncbi:Hypothetical protein, putative [Bodo saltans]|uniref:Uncharacterized protein n=1 Tax=Bodo saltans TaxID=75058 RepID=A0A0S4ILS0_BODSA|nr:Hypothetical protein, putative [Bodo saltans]|eukprot:CUE71627.1 Hypothetical protein, putative [Bodo saltans]